jgi:hypothetical protein
MFSLSLLTLLAVTGCTKSCGKKTDAAATGAAAEKAPEGPKKRVFFVNIKDGDTVRSPFNVQFGIEGMTVRPAGEDVMDKTSGHHHILINVPEGFVEQGHVIPVDEHHIHYGKGQTEATITLPPGKHTLSMQLGDGAHLSYGKEMAATIHITVEE